MDVSPEDGRQQKPPRRFLHIGMRSVKTVVAVFICCVIDFYRGAAPVQSTIAAVLCIQPDAHNSIKTAVIRVIGTLMGGLAAALMLAVFRQLGRPVHDLLFYLILSLLLFILISISVRTGFPETTALTCIIYLVIALSYTGEVSPLRTALGRVGDTLVGIVVAVPVNLILPTNHGPDSTDNTHTGAIVGRITGALERKQKNRGKKGQTGEGT